MEEMDVYMSTCLPLFQLQQTIHLFIFKPNGTTSISSNRIASIGTLDIRGGEYVTDRCFLERVEETRGDTILSFQSSLVCNISCLWHLPLHTPQIRLPHAHARPPALYILTTPSFSFLTNYLFTMYLGSCLIHYPSLIIQSSAQQIVRSLQIAVE